MAGRGRQQEERQGDRGQKEEPVKGPKEERNMTLLRNWKAERPEGGEHKICILFSRLLLPGEKSWQPTRDNTETMNSAEMAA